MSSSNIPILMYHEITNDSPVSGTVRMHPSYFIDMAVFERQMQLVSRLNIVTVGVEDLLKGQNNDGKLVISFDDGHIGQYRNGFSVLKDRGLVGTFFIAVSMIDRENMMTWDHLREMVSAGMSVQSHGFSHKPLGSFTKDQIHEDLKKAREVLEDKLGKEICCLSLPHGSYNKDVIMLAKRVGYKSICTSVPGYNAVNQYLLRRINVRSEYDLKKFENIITGKINYSFPNLLQKIKSLVKDIIGHDNYLKLYRKVFYDH